MNMLEQFNEEQPDQLFDQSNSLDNDFQLETEELINEVFNRPYEPVYNPKLTKQKEQVYNKSKIIHNKTKKAKLNNTKIQRPKIYQHLSKEGNSQSFNEFLVRSQEKLDDHYNWLESQKVREMEKESKQLKKIPDILRGSREKLLPIYERCIELQKSKEKKIEVKRMQKNRQEAETIQRISFHPKINNHRNSSQMRTYEEYFAEKELWQRERQESVEKKRVEMEVQKLSECTFKPQLVAKYTKAIKRIIPGERVEERLMRSLQSTKKI